MIDQLEKMVLEHNLNIQDSATIYAAIHKIEGQAKAIAELSAMLEVAEKLLNKGKVA